MGIGNNSLLNLVEKFRSWINWGVDQSNNSREFWMLDDSCKMCYECDSSFTAFNRRHHCHSCGRVFCRKCMQGKSDVASDGGRSGGRDMDEAKFCKFCFQAIGREPVVDYDENLYVLMSGKNHQPPHELTHDKLNNSKPFLSDRLARFLEVQQGSPHVAAGSSATSSIDPFSPVSHHHSSSRSDEEDAEDSGKHFLSPSDYGQDVSDIDASSINNAHGFYSFKSLTSSPLDRPSMMTNSPSRVGHLVQNEQGGGPRSENDPLSDQESVGVVRRPETETVDLENTDDCTADLSIFQNHSRQVQQQLDFDNNGLIWFPPPPEDEGDDMENNFFEYDDEDDEVGYSGMSFSYGSFGSETFPTKERQINLQKEPLRAVVHGHFRALVSQLLKGEGIHVGSENGGEGWLEIVASLSWQAANFVKPDTSRGGSMDPGDYVKVKCMVSGHPNESALVKGVVCTKNIKHKRMTSQYRNPRLLLLGGALEYQRVPNQLASIDTLLQQEIDYLKMTVAKIEAHHPNVLLVEKSVSSYAQEYLLAKEISLVLNVKRPLLERIARCSGAHIVPSIDNLASTRVGHCEVFHLERVSEECRFPDQPNKKSTKTLMFFEGCPRRLGCTVLLRGSSREELKKVKHVVQYAVFAAHHLSLETSFLADEGATLPKVPAKPLIASPERLVNSESTISLISTVSGPCEAMLDELHRIGVVNDVDRALVLPKSDTLTQYDWLVGNSYGNFYHVSISSVMSDSMGSVNRCEQSSVSTLDESPYGVLSSFTELQSKYSEDPSVLAASVRTHAKVAKLENLALEEGRLKNHRQPTIVQQQTKSSKVDGDELDGDYFSTADNHPSILVSLSSHCVLKGMVCQRSQLYRIKFYGSFDKPLGRFLQDDLFDQRTSCQSCDEPAEAHIRRYTHQQGSLTISVRRLPSLKLPGERDGKIWMWHRCLRCTHKDGVPPATQRVVMSDAAWGLSFGKFLELSFSNNATANRVASCGHSLQRDCLRYYGFGSMVAFFRYSPIDILSVHLPPSMLEFNGKVQQEWLKREVAEVSKKIETLYEEVLDVLQNIEKRITSYDSEHSKVADFHNEIMELKYLLKNERNEYEDFLQPVKLDTGQPGKAKADILEMNRLKRCLLIDSYMWDRRLSLLDSFLQAKGSICKSDPWRLHENASHAKLKYWRRESFVRDSTLGVMPEENNTKSLTSLEDLRDPLPSEHKKVLNLQPLEQNPDEHVEVDLSVKSSEDSVGPADHESSFGYDKKPAERHSFDVSVEKTSLANVALLASNLSDQIDLAWTGSDQSAKAHPSLSGGQETGSVSIVNQFDNLRIRKVMAPMRVHSFDSALKFQEKINRRLSSASSHLSSARSFHVSGDYGSFVRDPFLGIIRPYSLTSPQATQRLSILCGSTPLFISSPLHMVSEGVRLLLPQAGHSNIVVAIYDNEPASIIAYALSSKEYEDSIADKVAGHESCNENCSSRQDELGNSLGFHAAVTTMPVWQSISSIDSDDVRSRSYGSEDASLSRGSLFSDLTRSPHVRISFGDDSPLPTGKVKFFVTCYFAREFDALRRKCCPSELDFIRSLSRCKRWSAQGGKSNVYFAKTLDERFIIKQLPKTELDSFEEFAPQYFKYLMDSLNSGSPTCLAKVLGIYQVTVKHLKGGKEVKMDLMVMENLFFERSISRVYDLKGSARSRYNSDTKGSNKVMLDLNLLETLRTKPIFLGSKAKRSLERAVWNDTSFLASVDVMDYSLLVGVDEERKELVLGIIDFMRQYTWDKHLETWVKASGILGGPKNAAPTVISPKQYKKRFRKAMPTYFLTVPEQWPS